MNDIRDDARLGFAEVFGQEPSGLWSAPGCLTLFGDGGAEPHGHTEGLAVAVDRRAVVAMGPREDAVLRVASALDGELAQIPLDRLRGNSWPEGLEGWAASPLGVAWALAQHGADLAAVPGLDVYIDSDVPAGAGLSSSTALESALALALDDVWRLGHAHSVLAALLTRAGRHAPGDDRHSGGVLGFATSFLGRADTAIMVEPGAPDLGTHEPELVELGFDRAGLRLVVIDTGLPQPATPPLEHGPSRHLVTERARVTEVVAALRTCGPAQIGGLLDAAHASLRDDFEVAVPHLELVVEVARANGALGARMTREGTALALAPLDAVSRIQVGIDGAFAEHGFGQPHTFIVAASHGAVRE